MDVSLNAACDGDNERLSDRETRVLIVNNNCTRVGAELLHRLSVKTRPTRCCHPRTLGELVAGSSGRVCIIVRGKSGDSAECANQPDLRARYTRSSRIFFSHRIFVKSRRVIKKTSPARQNITRCRMKSHFSEQCCKKHILW